MFKNVMRRLVHGGSLLSYSNAQVTTNPTQTSPDFIMQINGLVLLVLDWGGSNKHEI